MTAKTLVVIGALSAFLGVGLGAFGAHAIRSTLSERMLAVWDTAVQYHLVHALALVLVGVLAARSSTPGAAVFAGAFLLAGQVLFSGSLYLLAVTQARWLGPITPLGGVCLLVGWLLVAWAAVRGL